MRCGVAAGVERGTVGDETVQVAHVVLHNFGQRRRAVVVQVAERHAGEVAGEAFAQDFFQAEGGEVRDAEGLGAQAPGGQRQRHQYGGFAPGGAAVEQVFEDVCRQHQSGHGQGECGDGKAHGKADAAAHGVDDAPVVGFHGELRLGLGGDDSFSHWDCHRLCGFLWLYCGFG